MLVAGDRLADGAESISALAFSLGYDSESAFSTAFKRIMGCSPRQYGRSRAAVPAMRVDNPADQLEAIGA
jgi:AraC-like DNA-binding protein